MSQRAGELCHRVTIQHKTTTYDEYNYETEAWTEILQLFGKVEYLSVKDTIRAKAAGYDLTARLKLNKRNDIDTTMRVIYDGQTFQIVSPPKPDNENGRIYMTLELSLVE